MKTFNNFIKSIGTNVKDSDILDKDAEGILIETETRLYRIEKLMDTLNDIVEKSNDRLNDKTGTKTIL